MGWTYDPQNSSVQWSLKHLGIATARGQFTSVRATLDFSSDNPVDWSAAAEIDVDSITSGHAKRDEDIKGERYLDVARFPTLRFRTSRIEREDSSDGYRVYGFLTLHGVEREICLATTFNGEAWDPRDVWRRGFSAQTTIKRSDYEIHSASQSNFPPPTEPRIHPWAQLIGEDVHISIEMEARYAEDG
jgi:polyisoprenoid-binding protein YceI